MEELKEWAYNHIAQALFFILVATLFVAGMADAVITTVRDKVRNRTRRNQDDK